jgi:glutamine amidotransferase
MRVAVVDYQAGNLTSVKRAFERVGATPIITTEAETIRTAERIVVPGVGHFARTSLLDISGLKLAILEAVRRRTPLLGICLGMQWLFTGSCEAPGVEGLGLMAGTCERFPSTVKCPHVGWNQLEIRSASRLFRGVTDGSYVYFTHSFRALLTPHTSAVSEYGGPFSAAVESDHIFGVQFHPEKSGTVGLQVLSNFCSLPC